MAFFNPAKFTEEALTNLKSQLNSKAIIAASGGVWVTTNSTEIWAEETTLTGSIGVYSIIPTLGRALDWAGVNIDGVSSTKMGEWDPSQPMPD